MLTPQQAQMMSSAAPAQMIGTPGSGQSISANGMGSPQPMAQNPQLQALAQALMKKKMNNLITGNLPGTTPQSIGQGTAGSNMGTLGPQAAPLSLGGNSGALPA